MKCDEGTIKNSGYTLCPDCGVTEKEVEELLDKGKNNWTGEEKKKFKKATFGSNRYTVGGVILFIIVVLAFGQVLGGTVAAVAVSLFSLFKLSDPSAATSLLQKSFHINALGESVVALIGFAFMFLGIVIFAKPFLNTNIKHMIAGRKKFDWKLFWLMFVSYIVILGIASYLCTIGKVELNSIDWSLFLPMFVFTLIFIPMQTTTEEIFFRCLLARIFYRNNLPKWPQSTILIIASGVLFTLPHLTNPEVMASSGTSTIFAVLTYFISGAGFMSLGLICGTFVPAVAVHFANNFFLSTVITGEVAALSFPTIFIDHSTENVEIMAFVQTLILYVIICLIAWLYTRRKAKK